MQNSPVGNTINELVLSEFWTDRLKQMRPVQLGFSVVNSTENTQQNSHVLLSEKTSKQLLTKTKGKAVNTYKLGLAALYILLNRYSKETQLSVISPVPQLDQLKGVNNDLLAPMLTLEEEDTVKLLLGKIHQDFLVTIQHSDFDLLNLLDKTGKSEGFNVGFQVSGFTRDAELKSITALTFRVDEEGGKFTINLEWNNTNLSAENAEQLLLHYQRILDAISSDLELRIGEIDFVFETEVLSPLTGKQITDSIDFNVGFVRRIEQVVISAPDRIAVDFEGTAITYQELNERANKLSHYLVSQGVQPGDRIGVVGERSAAQVVRLLAILKSGCAYVPIDSTFPLERKKEILKNSQAQFLLAEKEEFGEGLEEIVQLVSEHAATGCSNENLDVTADPEDLLYIMFSSGTTGKPKGIMVNHKSILNLLLWYEKKYEINENTRIVQITNLTIDIAFQEIFSSLMAGATLYVPSTETSLNKITFIDYLNENKITFIQVIPDLLKTYFLEGTKVESIEHILCGGDKLNDILRDQIIDKGYRLYDVYGQTETAIDSVISNCTAGLTFDEAIQGYDLYILDDEFNYVLPGTVGQICTGGIGLGIGYLNDPEQTAEKFVNNPHGEGKLYLTGDLGRRMPDGTIQFIGREDNQVKIRGYRTELAEVEKALLRHPSIDDSVVTVLTDDSNDKSLVGYFIANSGLTSQEIRSFLKQIVPDYMIPGYFVEMEHFPISPNGKVEKTKLPLPNASEAQDETVYRAPESSEEIAVVEAIESVLKREKIGIDDNFYDLGGDSIKCILVVSKLKQEGFDLKVEDLLKNPVLKDLAALLQRSDFTIDQSEVVGIAPLTPIQQFFFDDPGITVREHFNQSVLLKMKSLNIDHLEKAMQQLTKHHDALRAVFAAKDGVWTQKFSSEDRSYFSIESFDFGDSEDVSADLNLAGEKLQSNFDLEQGPLVKLGVFRCPEDDRVLIAIHHLVIDGLSWRVLLEDLETLLVQLSGNSTLELPLKTSSYKEWANIQKTYFDTAKREKEKQYWLSLNEKVVDDWWQKNSSGKCYKLDGTASFTLNATNAERAISGLHNVFGTDINDLLLAGLGLALKNTLGIDRSLVRMEGHGREEIFDDVDVSRTVGWFTSIYPFLLDVSGGNELTDTLVSVKESARKVPNKGVGYGILQGSVGDTITAKVPGIEFNYLGSFDQDKEDASFEVLNETAGNSVSSENKSETMLNVHGIHMDNQLVITMDFAKEVFDAELMERLSENYENALLDLLNALDKEPTGQLTPSDLTFSELSLRELEILNSENLIEDVYSLSALQEGMYYHWSLSPDSVQYVNQTSYRISGSQQIELIEQSYAQLLQRHGALRTSFTEQFAGKILQVVRKSVPSNFLFVDGRKESFDLEEFKNTDREKGFDLNDISLMRLTIVQLGESDYEFIWSSHHILMDGWCVSVLVNDFFEILKSNRNGNDLQLETPKPYSDYIEWISDLDESKSLEYWKELLDGYNEAALIPSQSNSIEQSEPSDGEITRVIDGDKFHEIDKFCRKWSITLNTYFQGVWGYLLGTYNFSRDVVFGSVVSGRPATLDGAEEMIGLFINTIPVRVFYTDDDTPESLLERLQQQSIEGMDHHYMNLSDVQSQSKPGMDLINHIMVFENYAVKESSEELQMQLSVKSVEVQEKTNYDFNLVIGPGSDAISVQIQYNKSLFSEQFVSETLNRFEHVLEQFAAHPKALLGNLSGVSQSDLEKKKKYETLNYAAYPEELTIVDAFAKQAHKNPDAAAVVFEEKTLTYRELDELSNQFANYLNATFEIEQEDLIVVNLDRSEWLLVTILAVLKTGAAYVPVDPTYPQERIEFIKSDAGCRISIDQELLNRFISEKEKFDSDSIPSKCSPQSLAYIIYTSGTTGKPKGVQVEHSNVIQLLFNNESPFDFKDSDVWTMFHSYCFDFSVWEMYGALLFGGKLVVVPDEVTRDVEKFAGLIQHHQVTVLNQTPSVFKVLQEQVISTGIDVAIRYVIFGGEALYPEFLANWKAKFKSCRLINMYGITETTVHVTYKELTDTEIHNNVSNIGHALPTLNCHVFGKDGQLVPEGIPGELFVSGHGLGRGYLNRSELTAERFVVREIEGKKVRLYRSGDLVRRLSTGELEYLGRIDNQVKIRGYRIELGEVADALKRFDLVKDATVLAWGEESNKFLFGYYLSDTEISEEELFQHMSEQLPAYMVPAGFIRMDSFPITKNGKLDTKQLPAPEFQSGVEYVPPGNELEEQLVAIWADLLKEQPENIGINHHFFDAGANSLSVTKLSLRIKNELNCEVSLVDIFERPVLKEQATFISNQRWLQEDVDEEINLNEIEI